MKTTHSEAKRKSFSRHQSRAKGRDIRVDRQSIPELLRMTYDENADTRFQAVQYLCPCHVQSNYPEIWDRLFQLTTDPDLKIRKTIFHILGDGSPNERVNDVIQAVEKMYHDPDLKMRRVVRKFLAQYRRTGKVNVL